jgi:hypothetical protein
MDMTILCSQNPHGFRCVASKTAVFSIDKESGLCGRRLLLRRAREKVLKDRNGFRECGCLPESCEARLTGKSQGASNEI